MTLATTPDVVRDPQGNPYMTLPGGKNFADFEYVYIPVDDTHPMAKSPSSYTLTVTCLDHRKTKLQATPDGIDVVENKPTKDLPTARKDR